MQKQISFTIALILALFVCVPLSVSAAESQALTATPTASTILVDGIEVAFDAYNIEGSNYFKLRDLAYVMRDTPKQFEVGYDSKNNAISLTSNKRYTEVGGEMAGKAAGSKTATPTTSKIYLDGGEVRFTAYNIEGNNYFKLRDIGEALDFSVDWDEKTGTVIIDTQKKEMPELTETAVYNTIIALKDKYPDGMPWTNDKSYTWKGDKDIIMTGYGCLAFAYILSDEAFGTLPARKHTNLSEIKIGDILRIDNETHSVVVIAKDDEKVTVAEGNLNNAVYWGREFTWQELKKVFNYAITRYPQ